MKGKADMMLRELGSILIHVLWILVIITALALNLGASGRASVLDYKVASRDIEEDLLRDSAQSFAEFKLLSGLSNVGEYNQKINQRQIEIKIFNENGFISIYELSGASLLNAFKVLNMGRESIEKLEKYLKKDEEIQKLNDEQELGWILGLSQPQLWLLMERVSIFHDGPVNPRHSPLEVLRVLSRVDQLRVAELAAEQEPEERLRIRQEIVDQLQRQELESGEDLSPYYRILIRTGRREYRIHVRYDRREKRYKTLASNSRILKPGTETEEERS
jgi:hypothetical protein